LYHTAKSISAIDNLSCFSEEEKKYITSVFIEYPAVGKVPGHYIREMYAYSKSMFEEFERQRLVDFVYVQGLCGMYLLENKKQVVVPIGINFHGLEMFQQTANLKSKLEQYLFKRPVTSSMLSADLVFSLGGKLTDIIRSRGVVDNKIIQIPIGIDQTWIRKLPIKTNAKRKFVFVGRYERRKGIEELTQVIKQLLPANNFTFDFIGDITNNKKIISENVFYHGSISDVSKIKKILTEADVLVCPSYSEGMPTVILEAMALGLAIIASRVGAVEEEVDATNGLLISPGNKEELKQAINRLIQMPSSDFELLKNNSIKKIKNNFLWDKIILKTIDEINRAIVAND
jgi:glycosyltransferase involved in cell wall biosynthesis